MSGRDIDEFLERMKADGEFSERILGPVDPEARLAVARAEGYDLTLDQLGEHANLLRDACLEAVTAAGADCPTKCDKRIEPQ